MLSDPPLADNEIPAAVNFRGRRILRPSGLERRQQILDATLRIIVREGMRGVRHRAVAAEASVPLAATTYYFRDIEDLITAAFLDWARRNAVYPGNFRQACVQCVEDTVGAGDHSSAARRKLVDSIVELAADYVVEQVTTYREHRIIELAFQHEAYGNEKLKAVVQEQHELSLHDLEAFYAAVCSPNPGADASITYGLMLRIEQDLFMRGTDQNSRASVVLVFRHLIESLLDITAA